MSQLPKAIQEIVGENQGSVVSPAVEGLEKLTPLQRQVLPYLVAGLQATTITQYVPVTAETISRWTHHDEEFQVVLRAALAEGWKSIFRRIEDALYSLILGTLMEALTTGDLMSRTQVALTMYKAMTKGRAAGEAVPQVVVGIMTSDTQTMMSVRRQKILEGIYQDNEDSDENPQS